MLRTHMLVFGRFEMGLPTWLCKTAGGWVKSARKVTACATSHARAAIGAEGGRRRPAGFVAFLALTAPRKRGANRGVAPARRVHHAYFSIIDWRPVIMCDPARGVRTRLPISIPGTTQ